MQDIYWPYRSQCAAAEEFSHEDGRNIKENIRREGIEVVVKLILERTSQFALKIRRNSCIDSLHSKNTVGGNISKNPDLWVRNNKLVC